MSKFPLSASEITGALAAAGAYASGRVPPPSWVKTHDLELFNTIVRSTIGLGDTERFRKQQQITRTTVRKIKPWLRAHQGFNTRNSLTRLALKAEYGEYAEEWIHVLEWWQQVLVYREKLIFLRHTTHEAAEYVLALCELLRLLGEDAEEQVKVVQEKLKARNPARRDRFYAALTQPPQDNQWNRMCQRHAPEHWYELTAERLPVLRLCWLIGLPYLAHRTAKLVRVTDAQRFAAFKRHKGCARGWQAYLAKADYQPGVEVFVDGDGKKLPRKMFVCSYKINWQGLKVRVLDQEARVSDGRVFRYAYRRGEKPGWVEVRRSEPGGGQ